jgi:hypothetical protein
MPSIDVRLEGSYLKIVLDVHRKGVLVGRRRGAGDVIERLEHGGFR